MSSLFAPFFRELLTLDASGNSQEILQQRRYDVFTIQLAWIGAPVGKFTIETSTEGTDWDELGITAAQAVGTESSHTFHINLVTAVSYRVKYTKTSGTGACVITITGIKNGNC
jgi:hypothetical protein